MSSHESLELLDSGSVPEGSLSSTGENSVESLKSSKSCDVCSKRVGFKKCLKSFRRSNATGHYRIVSDVAILDGNVLTRGNHCSLDQNEATCKDYMIVFERLKLN